MSDADVRADASYRSTLARPGVRPFLWAQGLGAVVDGALRALAALAAVGAYGAGGAVATAALGVLPFVLASGYAGYLADRISRRTVIAGSKAVEAGAAALAAAAILAGRVDLLLAAFGLASLKAALASPARYAIVPDLVPETELSRANGLLGAATFGGLALGTALGVAASAAGPGARLSTAIALAALAAGGLAASLRLPAVPAADPARAASWNPFAEPLRGLARLRPDGALWITALGLACLWGLAGLVQAALVPIGPVTSAIDGAAPARLFLLAAAGAALGCLAAGRLSGERVEPGLVPIGSIGAGLCGLGFAASTSAAGAGLALGGAGLFAGLFVVPLYALLEQRAAAAERGRILAASSVLNAAGVIAAGGLVALASGLRPVPAGTLVGAAGALALAGSAYGVLRVRDFFVRFVLWSLTHSVYRITVAGRPHVPRDGPALIIANHISMIDGALIGACVQRFVRFLVHGPHFHRPGVHAILRRLHAIPITAGDKDSVAAALDRAREELRAGHVVCIFAEGSVSRTGNLLPFRRGFERILEGLDVPVIPVYLDRVWGSVFSFKYGRFFWKLPERLPYPVTVVFGRPLASSVRAPEARLAIMELAGEAMACRRAPGDLLHLAFVRTARRHWRRPAVADSTGVSLTYGRTLAGAVLLGRMLARRTRGERYVGLLLPASAGGALANLAVLFAGRVPINLNFTLGDEAIDAAAAESGLGTIVTSRRFLERASLRERPGLVFLEDLRAAARPPARLGALAAARVMPARALGRRGPSAATAGALATVVFSSGSTGVPKGVMLTHANILANIDALAQVFSVGTDDRFIGVLPFFHSFGLTATFWFPLLSGCGVAYHPNPRDARAVGELAAAHRGTVLVSTPTFCQAYLRRCTPEQFGHLRYVIVGAEKLREPLARAFEARFGVTLLEGYGCTEMAPVVAVNLPDVEHAGRRQVGTKPGSVGQPIPGVAAKVVDRDTGEGPLFGREGLLLVKGPNLMAGYLNRPDLSAEALRDGWYVTGDIASMDEDGFLYITDRLARFSKIGGEMVPHVRLEDAINDVLGEAASVVTAVPDAAKGERLVAFYTRPDVTPDALWAALAARGLPRLWLPRPDSLFAIDAIPTLGTGKVDLRAVRELAHARLGDTAEAVS